MKKLTPFEKGMKIRKSIADEGYAAIAVLKHHIRQTHIGHVFGDLDYLAKETKIPIKNLRSLMKRFQKKRK